MWREPEIFENIARCDVTGLLGWPLFGILPLLHEPLPHWFEPRLRPLHVVLLGLSGVLFKAIEYEYYVVLPSEVDHAIPSAFVGRAVDQQFALWSTRQKYTSTILGCVSVRDDSQGLVETCLPHILREPFPVNPAVYSFRLVVRQTDLARPEAPLKVTVCGHGPVRTGPLGQVADVSEFGNTESFVQAESHGRAFFLAGS